MNTYRVKPFAFWKKKATMGQCEYCICKLGSVYKDYILRDTSFDTRVEIYEDIQRLFLNYRTCLSHYHIAELMGIPIQVVIHDFVRLGVDLEYLSVYTPETLSKYKVFCQEHITYFCDNYFFTETPKKKREICRELGISVNFYDKCLYIYFREYGLGINTHQIRMGMYAFFNYNLSYPSCYEYKIKQFWTQRSQNYRKPCFEFDKIKELNI